MTLWIDPKPQNSPPLLDGLHPLVSHTLFQRGITASAAAKAFLDPSAYNPTSAFDLPDMEVALERLNLSIFQGEAICVWGDFDVDGQTSTTILVQTLQALGANVRFHIPLREGEGHGIYIPRLKEIIDAGARLLLTCDTGITAHKAVDYANSRGVDVIVTDHHDLAETLPKALALINPKRLPAAHPLATLPGAGVAYKLAEALLSSHSSDFSADALLDLVALGITADVADLYGDTRYLLQRGLTALRETKRLGLRTLMTMADLNPVNLTEEHIGFMLAPRLNALGRLSDANPIVELFTTEDSAKAQVLTAQLEGLNSQRKLLTSQVYQGAEAQLRAEPALLSQPVLVLAHPDWPGGVLGIAASRLVERYHKPVILLCAGEGETLRGSARSVAGINIGAAIAEHKSLLNTHGGHPMAAGLSFKTENLSALRKGLGKTITAQLGDSVYEEASLQLDAWLNLSDISLDLTAAIEQLAPFGPGNEKLVFATRALKLEKSAIIGRGKEHRRLTVSDESGQEQEVLWWNGAEEDLPEGKFDLAYSLRSSDYRGQEQTQMKFIAFRVVEAEKIHINRPKLKVIDYRATEDAQSVLRSFDFPFQLWAEGADKKILNTVGREELQKSQTLVIWSAPASAQITRFVMQSVQPERVILFAQDPQADTLSTFLERLAGLAKYILHHRSGSVSLLELASSCAQPEETVLLGLRWLSAQGKLSAQMEEETGWIILKAASISQSEKEQAETLLIQIKNQLAETSAYRAYFRSAQVEGLL